jgi:hypothetical protein
MMVSRGRSYLVRAEHIPIMLCRTVGMNMVMIASVEPQENQQASGLDVTSCHNKNPSIALFFLVAYLE